MRAEGGRALAEPVVGRNRWYMGVRGTAVVRVQSMLSVTGSRSGWGSSTDSNMWPPYGCWRDRDIQKTGNFDASLRGWRQEGARSRAASCARERIPSFAYTFERCASTV